MFQRAVVGTDGSPTASEALKAAAELCALCGAELHIVSGYNATTNLHVAGAGSHVETWAVRSTDAVEGILRDATDMVRTHKLTVSTHHEEGDPAKALVSVANEVGADLIVVGNRGMRGVRRLLGSVPNDVAHKAPCAVLIIQTT
jgi:nucleotide-binding universal stress UspA family protein